MTTVQATFAATLVDEWVRNGVSDIVVSPGSRSSPLAIALASDPRLEVHVHHDERAASFLALGIGKATNVPAVLLCTSGTAAAELHAAVVEAHQARVPMLVCTADRPPELQSVGAPQTIDQTHLYGRAVRWFADPGVADAATSATWRSLASRALLEATSSVPGPVHLNLPFRDPLVGTPGELPPGRADGAPWHRRARTWKRSANEEHLTARRGLIVAGAGAVDPGPAAWPVLADPMSGMRTPGTVGAFDALLRTGRMPTPELVVRVGDPPASKVLAQWLAALDVPQLVVGAWNDPDHTASTVIDTMPIVDVDMDPEWIETWVDAEMRAQRAIDEVLSARPELTEPFVARTVAAHASTLVVSSSMPVRDVEWYAAPRDGLRVYANRGANGIDGVVSTAVGVALATGGPVTVLVGDVAFLHDSNALLGLADRGVDLTIVVVDNRGGGIFSFLPQASELDAETFERLFGTPHDVDIATLAAAHGIPTLRVHDPSGLQSALDIAAAASGTHVVLAPTDRAVNVAVHDAVHAAVAAALG
ncbi:MAG: 2-succinyl-5-enolpyruvyl-6-hydroxy-3-cyclohexene-carboxylate synthase [Actinomycetota bacterium]|nr:2-succinyl-5-enolpyruvyl-6-hydroxy-3-cyclohexene-carboxylate synthase [Actinomycetota bacterium]